MFSFSPLMGWAYCNSQSFIAVNYWYYCIHIDFYIWPLQMTLLKKHYLTNGHEAIVQYRLTKFCKFLRDHILDTLHELGNAHSWQKIVVATHCKIRGLLPWANHSMCHIGKCWRSVACLFIGVSKGPQQRVTFCSWIKLQLWWKLKIQPQTWV